MKTLKPQRTFLIIGLLTSIYAASLFASEKLTILYLNDTHGQIEPIKDKNGNTYGGFARIAWLVDSLRLEAKKSNIPFRFLHGGDVLMGPPLSNLSAGALDFECLNDMGLNAMAVGNHEFDFGPEQLVELGKSVRFPMLAANITDRSGGRVFQPFLKETVGRTRLLIVGLSTETTPYTTYPANVEYFRFYDAESTLTALLDSLRYGPKDLIVVLSHRGWQADSAMAEHIHSVDLIIGGHSHSVFLAKLVGRTLICQAGTKGMYVGQITLDITKGNITRFDNALIPVTDSITEDPNLAAKIRAASQKLDEKMKVPIGKTDVALVPGFAEGQSDALSLGDLLARLMKEKTNVDVAFTNQGGVRARIEPGPITTMDVYTALPFNNTVVAMDLTGAQLNEVLDRNFSAEAGGVRHHFYGIEWRNHKPATANALINGKPIDPKKTYRIATNNFLAQGGDGYFVLTSGQHVTDTGTTLNELLIRYIERVGTITGKG